MAAIVEAQEYPFRVQQCTMGLCPSDSETFSDTLA